MKTFYWAIVFSIFFCFSAKAQNNYTIKGSVSDTATKKSLYQAEVVVLNAKDSILVAFTRVKTDGSFSINNLKPGQFILLIGYMDYTDYTDHFTLDDTHTLHDFGALQMTQTSRLLKDVIIQGKPVAIRIKGDTTEFNARAYVIQPNDKVEDLLKRFPGIRIDKNGKITAQGQHVDKVLLDGEEFFADDPTLLTKNVRADMVDKVQLYDKKSDRATFTGIDDGITTKTLNIKLKKNKESGSFGNASAGYGTNKNYTGQIDYNKFRDKEKFALYGINSNVGTGGSDADDSKYEGLEYNNRGIPKLLAGGAHYNNKWDTDKYAVNVDYRIGKLNVDGVENDVTQNNLPGRFINSNNEAQNHNATFRQRVNAILNLKLDTTSNLKITLVGAHRNIETRNTNTDTSRRADNTLLNTTNIDHSNQTYNDRFTGTAFYTKKLNKKKRTFSILVSGSSNESTSTGFLKSKLDYYDPSSLISSEELIDQQKLIDNKNTALNAGATYTEPLTKALTLEISYNLKVDNTGLDQRSYSRPSPGAGYSILVDSLSNNFKLNQFLMGAEATFNYNKGNMTASFGTGVSNTSFDQIDTYAGSETDRHFINWSPKVNLTYHFSPRKFLIFGYGGRAILPTINQIQSIKDNTNPLFVTLGNPTLNPSFLNSVGAFYNGFQVVGSQSLLISAKYTTTSNPIVTNLSTDSIGKTTVRYANLSGRSPYAYNLHVEYGRNLPGMDLLAAVTVNLDASTDYNMVTNTVINSTVLNTTKNRTYYAEFFLSKSIQDKLDVSGSLGPQYTVNQSSLQINNNGNSSGFKADGSITSYLPCNFLLASNINYDYTAQNQILPAFRRTLWNASISKVFLKSKALKITSAVNDILNQNRGYSRTASGGIISEQQYSTIKRYFMLSIFYDFTTMGKGPKD